MRRDERQRSTVLRTYARGDQRIHKVSFPIQHNAAFDNLQRSDAILKAGIDILRTGCAREILLRKKKIPYEITADFNI